VKLEVVEALAECETVEDLGDVEGVGVAELEDVVGAAGVRGRGCFGGGAERLDRVEEGLAESASEAGGPGRGVGADEASEAVCLEVGGVVEVGEGVADLQGKSRTVRDRSAGKVLRALGIVWYTHRRGLQVSDRETTTE
jgi:hypothetical protein